MDLNAIAAASNSGAQRSATALADNFDTFLTLLTTQLQNQDPLSPMDTTEFTQQLVQFSEVEQSISTNKNLELLVALAQAASAGNAVSYLGKEVMADGNEATLKGGSATWHYNLARDAKDVILTVLNEKDVPVFSSKGEPSAGLHGFTWDGRNANGVPQADGPYALQIKATDASGNSVVAETSIRGKVSAVDFEGSEPHLVVGGSPVQLAKVRGVLDPAE